jgi:hypothetical protein
MIDQAEEARPAPIVSTPAGQPSAGQVELAAAGVAPHRTLPSAIDQVADERFARLPDHGRTAARRRRAETSRLAHRRPPLRTATTAVVPPR